MSETKHTREFKYFATLTASENHKGFTIIDGSTWIADVSPLDSDGIEGEQITKLFAAAPRTKRERDALLEVCEHTLHGIETFTPGDEQVSGRLRRIRNCSNSR